MDGCSLDLAFPTGPYAAVDCQSRGAAEESRRQEKKKARRCRGPQATYLNGGMNMVGAIGPDKEPKEKGYPIGPQLNPKTGVYEHTPVTEQYNYETFVGAPEDTPVEMDNLEAILKDVKGPTALQSPGAVGFFGANPDDANTTASVSRRGLTESFTSGPANVNVIGKEEAYTLEPDFQKAFSSRGAQKAAGGADAAGPSPVSKEMNYLTPTGMMPNSILPVPNVDVFWKESGLAGGQSAFFSQLKAPGGQPSTSIGNADFSTGGDSDVPAGRREVLTKLDKIFARLDDMEAAKSENAQTEVLLFILTGLGIVFLMDVGCRAASAAVRR
jgi:hypothetical protein